MKQKIFKIIPITILFALALFQLVLFLFFPNNQEYRAVKDAAAKFINQNQGTYRQGILPRGIQADKMAKGIEETIPAHEVVLFVNNANDRNGMDIYFRLAYKAEVPRNYQFDMQSNPTKEEIIKEVSQLAASYFVTYDYRSPEGTFFKAGIYRLTKGELTLVYPIN